MLNKTILIGRLTRDPETRYLQNGTPTSSFTLAVDRSFKDRDGNRSADFIPVVAWGKTAELCGQYLTKGRQVAISGRIQTRSYDAKDGTKKYVTEVVAEEVTFLGSQSENKATNKVAQENIYQETYGGFEEVDEPF